MLSTEEKGHLAEAQNELRSLSETIIHPIYC